MNVVSRTSEPGTYARVTVKGAVGAIEKWPASGSRIRENSAGLSKRGRHSQSIEPSEPTSAAELQSESIAYSPIGRDPEASRAGRAATETSRSVMGLTSRAARSRYAL